MTTPRFLVSTAALAEQTVALTGAELRHVRARRLRPGSAVVLSDGHGHERSGVISGFDRHAAIVRLLPASGALPATRLRLGLAQALLKGDKLDWVVEKATELGVEEIILFASTRTIRRVTAGSVARWHRVAAAASKQSQRSSVPVIVGPLSFAQMLERQAPGLALFFWEQATATIGAIHRGQPRTDRVATVVGPEGGFSAPEAAQAETAGFHTIGLGPRTLRAETAAVAVLALCQFLWGDLDGSPERRQLATTPARP